MMVEAAILDMDGTLYAHKDPSHHERERFYDTFLGIAVAESIVNYIATTESISGQEAEARFVEASTHPVGPSVFLGDKYGIGRAGFFEATWGEIDVERFVHDEDINVSGIVVEHLKSLGICRYLLTAAPKVWATKILQRLGLDVDDVFDGVFYGEDYMRKEEVFSLVAEIHPVDRVISIGDEYDSDILPARRLGMQTFHITNDNPLIKLIDLIN